MEPPVVAANPYAAPVAAVADGFEMQVPREPARRMRRLGAVLLDGVVVGIPYAILFGVMYLARHRGFAGRSIELFVGTMSLATLLLLCVIVIDLVLLYRHGQTIGKRWLKIRIVRRDGSRCGLLRIIFLRVLPISLVALSLGFFLSFLTGVAFLPRLLDALFVFRADRRCIHDHIADTVVVKA